MDTTLPVTAEGMLPRTSGAGAALIKLVESLRPLKASSPHTGADPSKYKTPVLLITSQSCLLTAHWMLEQHCVCNLPTRTLWRGKSSC